MLTTLGGSGLPFAKRSYLARPSAATQLWHRRPACDPTGETPVPQFSPRQAKKLIVCNAMTGLKC